MLHHGANCFKASETLKRHPTGPAKIATRIRLVWLWLCVQAEGVAAHVRGSAEQPAGVCGEHRGVNAAAPG